MKNNGFSKDRYLAILRFYLIEVPIIAMICFAFVFELFGYAVKRFGTGALIVDILTSLVVSFLAIAILSFTFGVLNLIFGPSRYKRYACQVIDFDAEDVELESIKLTDKKLRISYYIGRDLEHVDIEFARYGIKVKKNKACKMPTFLIEGNRVKKLILPDTDRPKMSYSEYKVIYDLLDNMLCV